MIPTDTEIKEWFSDHKATMKDSILEWKNPDSIIYYIRYVFDCNHIYVTGDMGSAIFSFSEKANPYLSNYDLWYFHSKLVAFSEDKWDFNHETALKYLKENIEGDVSEVIEGIKNINSRQDWVYFIHENEDLFWILDSDYGEWAYNIGNEIPVRVRAYKIGLEMAAQQLKVGKND